ncbi:MAG: cobalamin biosynthesis protein [Dehalococcoidales bacterium]|nr:cobalamin biosynthesis protein [Dehalococcoidales bacterium]
MEPILCIAIAVALDIAFGEPPNAIHPVAWMGRLAGALEGPGHKMPAAAQLGYGVLMTLLVIAVFTAPVYFLMRYLSTASTIVYVLVGAVLLKTTFSIRGLRDAAVRTRNSLEKEEMDRTSYELRALVSRNTENLPPPLLASAAVESVAENIGDSIVAPLFYFLIGGLPAAFAYRAVNTLDAMVGYHGKYEYLGKFAARLDDVLNYIPSRIAALLIILAAALKKRGRYAMRLALSEHRRTESPNAGWPMSAMAGALGVRLEKVGHYVLGGTFPPPCTRTIGEALGIFWPAVGIWVVLCLGAGGVYLVLAP